MKNSDVVLIIIAAFAAGWISRGEYDKYKKRTIKPASTEGGVKGTSKRIVF